MSADLAFMSAVELAQSIREKKISSLEATENFFQRIDRLDSQLNSYLTLCQDQALADARAADDAVQSGSDLGPLHGVPISIKDLELTKGVRTTMGSAVCRGYDGRENFMAGAFWLNRRYGPRNCPQS